VGTTSQPAADARCKGAGRHKIGACSLFQDAFELRLQGAPIPSGTSLEPLYHTPIQFSHHDLRHSEVLLRGDGLLA
jgi:hypothetical protein